MSKFNTICVQGGYEPKNGEPRVLPLHQSTTYVYDTAEQLARLFDHPEEGHIYSRISNPTVDALEKKMALLEGGLASMATSSGLAAETLAILNVCSAGDNFVSVRAIYGGSYNLFNVTLKKYGITVRWCDQNSTTEEIENLIDDRTKLIFAESLANPAMMVCDFDKLSTIAKKYKVLFMVDNTLTTPYIVKPIEYGANIVIHSTTKYFDGHASCVGGMIVDAGNFDFTDNPRYPEFNVPDESYHGLNYQKDMGAFAFIFKVRAQLLRDIGACMSPFNAYLTNLGSETLALRMQAHSDNALACAKFLSKHKNVEWIKYSGLEGDDNYDLARKYFKNGDSGMVVFGVRGDKNKANQFMDALNLIKIVTHVADTRSCVLHPATTTHRQLSNEQLLEAGITENLVRLSIGIEDIVDILADLDTALNNIKY